jgi:hypothetical protein
MDTLWRAGWDVVTEGSAAYGLAAVAETDARGEPLDAVLVALELIGSDPFAFTSDIRRLGFAGAVAAVTAAEIDPAAAWEAGFDDCIAVAWTERLPERLERACRAAEALAAGARRTVGAAFHGHCLEREPVKTRKPLAAAAPT